MSALQDPVHGLSLLLQLARRARNAESAAALGFVAVNESRQLLDYRQSAVWLAGGLDGLAIPGSGGVAAVSGLPEPENNTPYGQWLDAACPVWAKNPEPHVADAEGLPEAVAEAWEHWLPAQVLVVPLKRRNGNTFGLWLLARDTAWSPEEIPLAAELGDAYGHAWLGFLPKRPWKDVLRQLLGDRQRKKRIAIGIAVVCLFPVRLTVLAPAEVVAKDAFLVRAPLDGVVDHFNVRPNTPVKTGQPLFELDTTGVRMRLDVARKAFEAASEEYRQAAQLAVSDDEKGKAELAQRKGRMEEKAAELNYSQQLLDRVQVKAPRDGVAVFSDGNDWIGKAVVIGERVMQIADPAKAEIAIRLPVADAIELSRDASVTLYLTTAPQYAYDATLSYAAYRAEASADGLLAYKLKADFDKGETPPRIGLTGTAKVYGSWVPFAYYVLRRPLAALRQRIGW